jgi:mannose-6-phosphate isomerase-like protein (cupin superfamily)
MIDKIEHNGILLSIIIPSNYREEGISFFTSNDLSQQLAFMCHPSSKQIQPHIHNPVPREVHYTQEVLFIRKGKLRVDFYTQEQKYLESRILKTGDAILLIQGGHGFEMLEQVEMIEVKQGPYVGEQDKTRFQPAESTELKIKLPAA